nr:glycosyltransferase 61 family protein [Cellulosimicrobium cellulans]
MHGFGHFLVETLPMLWPALQGRRGEFAGVCAHRFNARERATWQYELVASVVGDMPIVVIEEEPIQFAEVVAGGRVYNYPVEISDRALPVWDAVRDTFADGKLTQPVFLSRARLGAHRVDPRGFSNSLNVDAAFAARGFRVVHAEEFSIAEQVRLVCDAEIIAGQAGSALHLAAFARRAKVLEVGDARTVRSIVPTQKAIASVRSQLLAHVDYVDDGRGGLDLTHLDKTLERLGV